MLTTFKAAAAFSLTLLCAGCAVRSISDAGYRAGSNPLYRGELHDLDVIGAADPGGASGVRLRRGASLLVLQSGALMPDQGLLDEIAERGFRVGFLSGIPHDADGAAAAYRAAAARGGHDAIVCCWGVLESARVDNAGKAVSWVPIAGFFVHDEEQRVRIRLKLIVVDVASGAWTMIVPQASDDARTSAFVSRESSDQEQVQALKEKAYRAAAAELERLR
jgi:hypothetical protein